MYIEEHLCVAIPFKRKPHNRHNIGLYEQCKKAFLWILDPSKELWYFRFVNFDCDLQSNISHLIYNLMKVNMDCVCLQNAVSKARQYLGIRAITAFDMLVFFD